MQQSSQSSLITNNDRIINNTLYSNTHSSQYHQDVNRNSNNNVNNKKLEYQQQNSQMIEFVFSPVQLQNKLEKQQQQLYGFNNNSNINNNLIDNYEQIQNNNNNNPSPHIHHFNNKPTSQSSSFINSNSIVKRYQLLLITLLIMSSIASVKYSTESTYNHIKTITDRFNMYLLENTNPSIYQSGDNIDQSDTEIAIFQQMNQHFDRLVQVMENFTSGGDTFMVWGNKEVRQQQQEMDKQYQSLQQQPQQQQQSILTSYMQIYYINNTNTKTPPITTKKIQQFLYSINRRQFLLQLKQLQLQFIYPSNKRLQSLNITIIYTLSSRMMLNIKLQIDYIPNMKYNKNVDDYSIRIVQQLLAFFLLCSYLHNAYTIKIQNNVLMKLDLYDQQMRTLQANRAYWCYSLVLLNIITMLNETYAPLASFLQLLPIFQKHDSTNAYKYNFNTNLRYALPIVMRIFIPVVILLNGFIFYSMLMYPGEYFQDYATGFFSYVYQNFQVGTYEIFIQLQNEGNFAYMLYGVLYFYMVLVGSNLLPALFCTMIYIKIYQNDLKDYISRTIKSAICPKCGHANMTQQKHQNKQFQIDIQSPKISPYLKGKLSTVSDGNKIGNKYHNNDNSNKVRQKPTNEISLLSKVTKMFVQSQYDKQYTNQKLQLKSNVQKVKRLLNKLQSIVIKQTKNTRQLQLFDQHIIKFIRQVQDKIIFSPVKSPLSHHHLNRRG